MHIPFYILWYLLCSAVFRCIIELITCCSRIQQGHFRQH
uniref:Uncharacterized protein n=1 Tax=Rhizophora mucronata TaxID=61149 RepID=A0A2P2NTQ8_RHIMU